MRRIEIQPGTTIGRLTVIRQTTVNHTSRIRRAFECRCSCGQVVIRIASNLSRPHPTLSCGCLRREVSAASLRTHGYGSKVNRVHEYMIFMNIIDRCTNPKNPAWKHYGGRGIRICDQWRHDFAAFLSAVGHRPSKKLVLDRIENDGNYEPGNVRWTTRTVSARNRRIYLKPVCKNGHPFTRKNTKTIRRHGTRTRLCRQCQRDFAASYRKKALGQS